MDPNLKHYTDEFFKMHVPWKEDYVQVSQWIAENIKGSIFGDVGCGNGYLIENLFLKHGKKVWGVDGSDHFRANVDDAIRPFVSQVDLTNQLSLKKADAVICLEVAEHIEGRFSETLVLNIVSTGASTVLFTAAPPGQDGVNHVNLQLPHYWAGLFERHGYYLNVELSSKFRTEMKSQLLHTFWYAENWMVFEKKQPSRQELIDIHTTVSRYLSETFGSRVENQLRSLEEKLKESDIQAIQYRNNAEEAQKTLRKEVESMSLAVQDKVAENKLQREDFDAKIQAKEKELSEEKQNAKALLDKLRESEEHLGKISVELGQVYHSRAWKLVTIIRPIVRIIAPENSFTRRTVFWFWKKIKLMRRKAVFFAVWLKKIRGVRPQSGKNVNHASKKIAFIGHSYHKKTKSSEFFIELLKQFFEVEVIWDESAYGKPFARIEHIDHGYLGVIFWQNLPDGETLRRLRVRNQNIIFVPMYDAVTNVDASFVSYCQDFKIICFSKALHRQFNSAGLDTLGIQYFPEPGEFISGNPKKLFFWQRSNAITIKTILSLLDRQAVGIHMHRAVDPYHTLTEPTEEEIKKYSITFSDWFETRNEMLSVVKEAGIYVAPREREGIGLSFLEAMAMGKAVIAVDNPTMNEYIVHNETGYLFDITKPVTIDIDRVLEIQKNTFAYMQKGYKKWQSQKQSIIEFIKRP